MQHLTSRSAPFRVVLFAGWLVWPLTAFGQTVDAPLELVLAAGRPVEVALDHRVTVRTVGQPVTATVVQPIYVYDRIVLPAGTHVSGRVERLEAVMVNGTTTYEGQVTTKAGKKVTMELGADGKPTKK